MKRSVCYILVWLSSVLCAGFALWHSQLILGVLVLWLGRSVANGID